MPGQLEIKRMLLVEDDEIFACIVIRKLYGLVEVHWVNTLARARAVYGVIPGRFDIVVCDCMGVEPVPSGVPDISFAGDKGILTSA